MIMLEHIATHKHFEGTLGSDAASAADIGGPRELNAEPEPEGSGQHDGKHS